MQVSVLRRQDDWSEGAARKTPKWRRREAPWAHGCVDRWSWRDSGVDWVGGWLHHAVLVWKTPTDVSAHERSTADYWEVFHGEAESSGHQTCKFTLLIIIYALLDCIRCFSFPPHSKRSRIRLVWKRMNSIPSCLRCTQTWRKVNRCALTTWTSMLSCASEWKKGHS